MIASLFYFSGTGNTFWVSKKLQSELEGAFVVSIYSIEQQDHQKTEQIINNSDIIIVAYPVYGSFLPEPMKKFIDGLPEMTEKKTIAIVCTQMMFSGDGAWFYHKVFEDKGYEIKWTYHFNMPNNISVKLMPLPYHTDRKNIDKILNRCDKSIKIAAREITGGIVSLTGNGRFSKWLGLTQRPAFIKMVKKPMKSPFSVEEEKCNKCMRCIQICSENNITLVEGTIEFGTNCALCMRCYSFCPKLP